VGCSASDNAHAAGITITYSAKSLWLEIDCVRFFE
jgi:hypothetical protein